MKKPPTGLTHVGELLPGLLSSDESTSFPTEGVIVPDRIRSKPLVTAGFRAS
jgi:hypothetical protein